LARATVAPVKEMSFVVQIEHGRAGGRSPIVHFLRSMLEKMRVQNFKFW